MLIRTRYLLGFFERFQRTCCGFCAFAVLTLMAPVHAPCPPDGRCLDLYSSGSYWKRCCGLHEVPSDINANATAVYLDHNNITVITNNSFHQMVHCEYLDLGYNLVHTIEAGAWNGLVSLHGLDLGSNNISSLGHDLFEGLPHLQSLNLSNNNMSLIKLGAFNQLSSLQKLYLTNNQIFSLHPNMFQGLHSLESLFLNSSNISFLKHGAFKQLNSLKELYLQANEISSLDPHICQGQQSLKILNLNDNKISVMNHGAFNQCDSLEELHLENNEITLLSSGIFKGLEFLHLLRLAGNNISVILPGAFNGLKSLLKLDLQGHKILSLDPGIFDGLQSLNTLILKNNGISTIHPGAFLELNSTLTLSLQNNNISSLQSNTFEGLTSLEELNLEKNILSFVEPGSFSGLQSVRTIDVSHNQLTELPQAAFRGAHRPFNLTLGHQLQTWNWESLCWLEWEGKWRTICLPSWSNPRCTAAGGDVWDKQNCTAESESPGPVFLSWGGLLSLYVNLFLVVCVLSVTIFLNVSKHFAEICGNPGTDVSIARAVRTTGENPKPFGSVFPWQCDECQNEHGTAHITCEANGTWTGNKDAVCKSKNFMVNKFDIEPLCLKKLNACPISLVAKVVVLPETRN